MKHNTKKVLSVLICILLAAALALGTLGCSKAPEAPGSSVSTLENGATIGTGATSFTFVIVDADGNETTVTVNTDKATVGEALEELGVISGEMGDYGLYVKTVNGITADYDVDQTYWAFYIDGEYAMTSVDSTDVTPGSVYTFKVEK